MFRSSTTQKVWSKLMKVIQDVSVLKKKHYRRIFSGAVYVYLTWNLQIWVSSGKESNSIGQMKVMWVAWLKRKNKNPPRENFQRIPHPERRPHKTRPTPLGCGCLWVLLFCAKLAAIIRRWLSHRIKYKGASVGQLERGSSKQLFGMKAPRNGTELNGKQFVKNKLIIPNRWGIKFEAHTRLGIIRGKWKLQKQTKLLLITFFKS